MIGHYINLVQKNVFYTYLAPAGSFHALKGAQLLPNLTQHNVNIYDKQLLDLFFSSPDTVSVEMCAC